MQDNYMIFTDKLKTAKVWTEKVVETLKNEVLEVSLFGSVARRTDAEASDIDLIILVNGEPKKAIDVIFDKLGDAFLELAAKGVIIENIVENAEEWKKMEKKGFSFAKNVKDDKIVLYRRS